MSEDIPSWFYCYKLELPKQIQDRLAEEIILREWIEDEIIRVYGSKILIKKEHI